MSEKKWKKYGKEDIDMDEKARIVVCGDTRQITLPKWTNVRDERVKVFYHDKNILIISASKIPHSEGDLKVSDSGGFSANGILKKVGLYNDVSDGDKYDVEKEEDIDVVISGLEIEVDEGYVVHMEQ